MSGMLRDYTSEVDITREKKIAEGLNSLFYFYISANFISLMFSGLSD